MEKALVSIPEGDVDVQRRIRTVRGVQVILDRDLALLYGVETGQLNRHVKRNMDRFPPDFMFQLTKDDVENLKCQFGISSWGGDRHLPYAFTETGVAMLSGILRSKTAVTVNIRIMRAFVAMRRALASMAPVLSRVESAERRLLIQGFIYTVFTRPTVREWNDKVGKVNHEVNEVNGEVNEVNLHIVQILRDNPQCTIPDLATACNVSRATVDRAVKVLKDANRIRRIGGTRGHWEVCD